MSIRLRKVNGILIAFCAARSVEKPGDIYLDDNAHHALAEKFARDFYSEGSIVRVPDSREAALAEREESDNPNREEWEKLYTGDFVEER